MPRHLREVAQRLVPARPEPSPQERATSLDELIVTSADGEHLPIRSRNRHDPRHSSCLWAVARDVQRWHEIADEIDTPPESGPTDDEPVTYA
ncbi:hypothetical protein [Streptomyces sp. NPDC005077]|uniref:hypothetical protein n=1 Tax=Streptomyces sp. NPDC005077 TaxID=3154292 RepID=UPI00339F5C26